jgi:hypothetical protein
MKRPLLVAASTAVSCADKRLKCHWAWGPVQVQQLADACYMPSNFLLVLP